MSTTTVETQTIGIAINAPFERVVADLADPAAHPEWATEFFAGPAEATADGEVLVDVPRMGGPAKMKVEADVEAGSIDLYLARRDGKYGAPVPVRVFREGQGVVVEFTLTRFPGLPREMWLAGIESMQRELGALKERHEGDR